MFSSSGAHFPAGGRGGRRRQRRIASAAPDGTIRIFDMNSGGSCVAVLPAAPGAGLVTALAALPCGRRLIAGGSNCLVSLWSVRRDRQALMFNLAGHSAPVTSVCVLDSFRACSAALDSTILVWDLHGDGTLLQTVACGLDRVRVMCALGDERIATGGDDANVSIWDLSTGLITHKLSGHWRQVRCIALLPSLEIGGRARTWIVSGSRDHSAIIFDVDSGRRLCALRAHKKSVLSCVVVKGKFPLLGDGGSDDDGDSSPAVAPGCAVLRIATGSRDGVVHVWRVAVSASGAVDPRLDVSLGSAATASTTEERAIRRLAGLDDTVWDVIALDDGQIIAGRDLGKVTEWL
jgi:F-box and WD-40 domain protein CDC4